MKAILFGLLVCSAVNCRGPESGRRDLDSPTWSGITTIDIATCTDSSSTRGSGTLYVVDDPNSFDVQFLSRVLAGDGFGFESVRQEVGRQGKDLVFQVAAAFTPDWNVIEGFALERGRRVGQDSLLGTNSQLPYQGLVIIKDGRPEIARLDEINDHEVFVEQAISEKWSIFQQVSVIAGSRPAVDIAMPGSYLRRLLVEVQRDSTTRFGLASYTTETTHEETVESLVSLGRCGFSIVNAVNLDMGSVSEGYWYDSQSKATLLGGDYDDFDKYTNLLIMVSVGSSSRD